MTAATRPSTRARRWIWWIAFAAVGLYVAVRMGALALWAEVPTESGVVWLPNTFASVDHPFHVARAETLWRALTSGSQLRWVGQHQGGYPVEFYPLGEAWAEVALRALSLGTLAAENAHTLVVILLFLLPGAAYALLASEDGRSPAVAFLALALHISLPGGWYSGGYTELVQWGLVTNVAGAAAALLMLPLMLRYLSAGQGWLGVGAALLGAWAVYCNPRSLLGLAAVGAGVWVAVAARTSTSPGAARRRAGIVAIVAALLAAPELMALARFGDLYRFVRYSGYAGVGDYAAAAIEAVSLPVLALALGGLVLGLTSRVRLATAATALVLIVYSSLTLAIAFVPAASALAPQLEPTRLMPLQRLLMIYLAAAAVAAAASWLCSRVAPARAWMTPAALVAVAAIVLVVQTRPDSGPPPDPASGAIRAVSLYPVATSATHEQRELEAAVRAADDAAAPGTAMLVLGSALSWHQQLWAPLWTSRPLYYDNWLWSWRPDHAGTPGYVFEAGNHYPDPERALDRSYLDRHGIGAVVVTGDVRGAATRASHLQPVRNGLYDAYTVAEPVTTVTFDDHDAASLAWDTQSVSAASDTPGTRIVARVNWHPRWMAIAGRRLVETALRDDGYIAVTPGDPVMEIALTYAMQPLDWLARGLGLLGAALATWMTIGARRVGGGPFRLLSSAERARPRDNGWAAD